MSSNTGLYGVRKPKNTVKEISSLAFTSTLSSLLSSDHASSSQKSAGRPRPSKTKPDIFTSHNKGTKKRAARDLEDDDTNTQVHRLDIGTVDPSVLHRSKRKMKEKSKLYSAMKNGEYVAGGNEPDPLVDFDQKWADKQARGPGQSDSSDEEVESNDGRGVIVDYEDEYGRTMRGTKAEAERMERRKLNKVLGAEELDRMTARPAMPSNLIYGDTIQSAAFNPEEPILAQMEEIAKKRDRSTTPPEEKHYEADKEIRSKGVGFYSFSKDESTRSKEMAALETQRAETENLRKEREARKEKRKQEIAERRKAIGERRAQKQADTFLDRLTKDFNTDNLGLG
ncbi:hypothetical protein B7494_g2225 [Chlorociboria aeruginascens]|nr:hypothetical protein B7494_g2225 [Chlorociboria aeruginascens]